MTSVYGVTFVGARTQILNRLKERDTTMDQSVMYSAACYAAKVSIEFLFFSCLIEQDPHPC
jgi:DNA-directed RNA polymerase